ncbi:hypothetical protein BKA62DRAFT_287036 [Auriculariales sp. MPI-PUGE-AT-0066]|nr:hypothetical protein BKA62DRAFT_287036 [Auriculariales sp. MPI-PUGE-AT-0066]
MLWRGSTVLRLLHPPSLRLSAALMRRSFGQGVCTLLAFVVGQDSEDRTPAPVPQRRGHLSTNVIGFRNDSAPSSDRCRKAREKGFNCTGELVTLVLLVEAGPLRSR